MLFKTIISLTTLFLISEVSLAKNKDLTAHRAAGKFENLKLSELPVWTKDELRTRFKELRDKKFLSFEGEDRRIPWLYARDGCHTRSTLFIEEAERLGYTKPKKVFMFGSIEMKGAIIPYGSVEPWFHAAPIVQVDGEAIVLDPAVSFSRPLTLENWIGLIAKDRSKTIYSICEPDTYMQTSSCYNPTPIDRERLTQETQLYLKFERNILRNIGLEFRK